MEKKITNVFRSPHVYPQKANVFPRDRTSRTQDELAIFRKKICLFLSIFGRTIAWMFGYPKDSISGKS